MKKSHLVSTIIASFLAAAIITSAADAQRTRTIEEQMQIAERQRIIAEQKARDAKKIADAKAERDDVQKRLNSGISSTTAGSPLTMPNTVAVSRNRVWINFSEPQVTVSLGKSERLGYYVWRWNMTGGGAPFSLVLAADTAMRSNDLSDILKASRLRRCKSIFETSALACTTPVQAVVSKQGDGFRIELRDTVIVNSLTETRPQTVSVITFSPLGRSVSSLARVIYSEGEMKSARQ